MADCARHSRWLFLKDGLCILFQFRIRFSLLCIFPPFFGCIPDSFESISLPLYTAAYLLEMSFHEEQTDFQRLQGLFGLGLGLTPYWGEEDEDCRETVGHIKVHKVQVNDIDGYPENYATDLKRHKSLHAHVYTPSEADWLSSGLHSLPKMENPDATENCDAAEPFPPEEMCEGCNDTSSLPVGPSSSKQRLVPHPLLHVLSPKSKLIEERRASSSSESFMSAVSEWGWLVPLVENGRKAEADEDPTASTQMENTTAGDASTYDEVASSNSAASSIFDFQASTSRLSSTSYMSLTPGSFYAQHRASMSNDRTSRMRRKSTPAGYLSERESSLSIRNRNTRSLRDLNEPPTSMMNATRPFDGTVKGERMDTQARVAVAEVIEDSENSAINDDFFPPHNTMTGDNISDPSNSVRETISLRSNSFTRSRFRSKVSSWFRKLFKSSQ